MLRLVFGIEVVEVAEELIEAMHGRQELVAIAEMVLAELSADISEGLEQFRKGRILIRQSFLCARQSHLEQPGTHRTLAGNKRRASRSARLLSIVVSEEGPSLAMRSMLGVR